MTDAVPGAHEHFVRPAAHSQAGANAVHSPGLIDADAVNVNPPTRYPMTRGCTRLDRYR
jgi:hypothetical protein